MVKEKEPDDNLFRAFASAVYNTIDSPVTWFRGTTIIVDLRCCCYVSQCYWYGFVLLQRG